MFAFLLAFVLVAAIGGAIVIAVRNKAAYARSNELIPGVPTNAPASWAGSHDPEARLHRRLRDALAALRANQAFDDDGDMLDLRVELEHQAQTLDQQLISTAALPKNLRAEPLQRLTAAVVSIEQAVTDLATSSVAETGARLTRALDDVRARTGLVAQARAALDDLPDPEPIGGTSTPPAPRPTEWWDSAPPIDPPPEKPGTATG